MDLLSIANTYGLKRVYRRAVAEIENTDVTTDPIERVFLAKQLNIKKWLAPAYVALCTRTDPIEASEAEKLGMYTFVTLVMARESFHRDCLPRDRALSVTHNLRCCGFSPSQLYDGANGAKTCPACQRVVIPGPGIQPAFTNNNRRCCGNQPSQWKLETDGRQTCPSCCGIVLPAVVTGNLHCCGYTPSRFTNGTNGAKSCSYCEKIVILDLAEQISPIRVDDAATTHRHRGNPTRMVVRLVRAAMVLHYHAVPHCLFMNKLSSM